MASSLETLWDIGSVTPKGAGFGEHQCLDVQGGGKFSCAESRQGSHIPMDAHLMNLSLRQALTPTTHSPVLPPHWCPVPCVRVLQGADTASPPAAAHSNTTPPFPLCVPMHTQLQAHKQPVSSAHTITGLKAPRIKPGIASLLGNRRSVPTAGHSSSRAGSQQVHSSSSAPWQTVLLSVTPLRC